MNAKEQLDALLARLHEGDLDDAERKSFQQLLKTSPEALDQYLDHCEMETWLTAAGSTLDQAQLTEFPDFTTPVAAPSQRFPKASLWLGSAAAVIILVTIVANLLPGGSNDSGTTIAAVDPQDRDPWKVINATGSVKHPGLTETAMPKATVVNRPIKFNRDIRPILSETCFHCHGPDEHGRRADLRLDSLAGATADLGGVAAIVPGDLDQSEAWWRIISDDPDELMPPPESHLVLSEDQKTLIKRWIEEGAVYEGHWAYESPQKPELPKTKQSWGSQAIDGFVLARLEEEGMRSSPEAAPETLIRRLHFDLVGLPPSAKDVHEFVADYAARGETAWQEAITRLLDSPHFGERMAVPWMDQARYADTNGYSIDGGRDMWLWRDWVIHAYNENKPFDQFTVEQLAGDLLPEATPDQRVATGFNRNHMITHEGGTIPEENLTNYVADRVKTTSEVFLGLTMACAQCHDHKYDPISIKEYYEFFAFFNELGDRGLDGNAGRNAAPSLMAKTVIPGDELNELQADLAAAKEELPANIEGFDAWVATMRQQEATRGQGFEPVPLQVLDISSPNRPGPYELQPDQSVILSTPSKGLNAFSHALQLPPGKPVDGIRIHFFPHTKEDEETYLLTPHPDGVPKVTTVLVSADNQPAKQVDIYRQVAFAQATASSSHLDHAPDGVRDERNLHWWQPIEKDREQHLTLTFAEPVNPAESPFLSVMVFFGKNESLPYHWRIEAFRGKDTDSIFPGDVSQILQKEAETWTEAERELVVAHYRQRAPELEPLRVRIANLEERLQVLTQPHSAMAMDMAPKPRETFVLDRGQYDVKTEKVSTNTPRVLPALAAEGKASRLDLARWMTQPDHPLTARVAVNRLWGMFFGTGIVATSADFGSQGEWPSHPELLDWLATEFVESGWDQKALIRTIVSSATYRQDSAATAQQLETDPKNRLLARGPRFRLPAEFIRDQALAVSGLLVPRIGGPSVHPYQPPGLWKEVSHFGSTPATKQVFVQDKGEKLYRRSLYTFTKRTSPHPGMAAFDAPNREMCIVQRGVTNTPLQALVTLNDPQFAEAARVFAGHHLERTPATGDSERLQAAFAEIAGRVPSAEELATLTAFLTEERKRYQADPEAARALVSVGDSPVQSAVDAIEQAAWTQVSSLLLNLSETLTRS